MVDDCQPLFGAEFERVFYLHNLASGVKMHNVYMVYGGEFRGIGRGFLIILTLVGDS